MNVPLSYQISEYDCGPTSVMNAVSFLFDRKKIHPDIITGIYRYCLDGFNYRGASGVTGTSGDSLRFLAAWFNHYGEQRKFPVRCEYIEEEKVHFRRGSAVVKCIRKGGCAVLLCWLGCGHYVLLTRLDEENGLAYLFDPYYVDEPLRRKDITPVEDHPMEYNRIVPLSRLEDPGRDYYNLGEESIRECLLFEKTGESYG